jgi:hypothetical protein
VTVRALPGFVVAVLATELAGAPAARAEPSCAGADPWVLVALRADGWTAAQRDGVIADLRRTLAGQGIDTCLADAHPASEPLATLAIELPSESRASVDIEVRDAVTHKRVRRDVDLALIPPDGRELAIAIEADELLRASWAEIALDTVRARAADVRPQVAGSVSQVLAPARVQAGGGGLGARLGAERYLGGAGIALYGAEAVGRVRLPRRLTLEIAGGVRASPWATAADGRVRGLAAGASTGLLVRIAGSAGGAALEGGLALAASWLELSAQPQSDAAGSSYGGLLVVGRARLAGRLPLGRSLHLAGGLGVGEALHGVEGTDAGRVVTGASGLELGASVGVETP